MQAQIFLEFNFEKIVTKLFGIREQTHAFTRNFKIRVMNEMNVGDELVIRITSYRSFTSKNVVFQIDLQWMVLNCDPTRPERETCNELPVNNNHIL